MHLKLEVNYRSIFVTLEYWQNSIREEENIRCQSMQDQVSSKYGKDRENS